MTAWKPLNDAADFSTPIAVRYNAGFGIVMLLAALFIGSTGLLLGNPVGMILGAVHSAVALAFLLQPWFVVQPGQIGIRNLFGMTLRSHAFDSLAEFEVRGKHLHWRLDGKKVKGVGGFLVRSADWDRLATAVARAC